MPAWTTRFAFVAVLAAALAWLLLSEPGAERLAKWLQPNRPKGPEVGRLMEAAGSVKIIRDGQVEVLSTPLSSPFKIFSGDRVEVGAESSAMVILNSRDELGLQEMTAVNFQMWDERDPQSPVYATLIVGDVSAKKVGEKGKAYIVREGRLFLPGQKATGKPLALTVVKNPPLDMSLAEDETHAPPAEFDPESTLTEESATAETFGAEPETLSNEYIEETIVAKQGLLQKCWLARLKDDPNLKAQMSVQFQISRRGKVQDVKIIESSTEDEALKNCVVQVFERLSFRSFKGPEISLSYPIQFE